MGEVAAELSPYYYRDNFLCLCDTVEAQYADLLKPGEQALLDEFRALDFRAQCLYLRLVSRVGPWFRESRLDYPELGQVGPLLDILLDQAWVMSAEGATVEELGRLYTRAELLHAFAGDLPGFKSPGKPALLDAISGLGLGEAALLQRVATAEDGRVVAPLELEWVELLQLLFFGNRRQSLVEFVLSDLGIARYYPYPLDREHRLFPTREALDEYLACAALGDLWYELREAGDDEALIGLAGEIASRQVAWPSSERRWYRLCNGVARELERRGEEALALAVYGGSRLHPARERRARILERCGDWAGAEALCESISGAPWCEEEREAAARILPRVRRKLHGTPATRRRDRFAEIELHLPRESGSVEVQVAGHLGRDWQAVHYVENQLMNALFGLAFWEEIFAPIPGAFNNPFQSAPTDMYAREFSLRRRERLAARLEALRDANLRREMLCAHQRYRDFQCRWVNWRRVDEALVDATTAVVPACDLLAIWDRMLFDPGENRRGFPDLIALGDTPGHYRLIEVKAPGDALQESQKRWLRFFGEHDIPASVARVVWLDD
jgi:hypothetical protein